MTLDEIAAVLLDLEASPGDLKTAADRLYEMFCEIVPISQQTADTLLPQGRAISPHLAATCLQDAMRTAVFLRGVEQAMRERKPVQVLYAGTGPFAPLALPLVSRFPDSRFTFLDMHPFSADSVRRLVEHFGLRNCDFIVADATAYRHPCPIDLLIVEAMQAALSKEPQVAIVRNLAPQLASGGVLIPQRVTVDVVLVDGAARVRLGTAVDTENDTFDLTARVPINGYTLAYFTRIEVFGKHVLEEYQSGLTYPQMQWNVRPKAGQTLVFKYEMGPDPGLRASVIPSRADGEESPAQVRRMSAGDSSPSSRLGMTALRKLLPSLQIDDETLALRINQALTRAATKGYTDPAAIRLYVLLMIALGPHFDERARVREYFAGAQGSLDERLLKMPEWSHPNCWLRDENDEWQSLPTGETAAIDWPDSDSLPTQLQPGYGFQLDVPLHATPEPVVTAMLDLAELTPSDFLLDLGSGDGRIAIAAALRFGVRGKGIDIDPAQVDQATRNAHAAGVAHLVSFHRQDLLDADFTGATVVMVYLLGALNLRIRDRLRRQLRPGARVISRSFDMGDWPPDAVVQTELGPVYRWDL